MNVCSFCGKKYVSNKQFELHIKSHATKNEPEEESTGIIGSTPTPPPAPSPISDEITLKFKGPVEMIINGHKYAGSEITVKSLDTANEIVRIVREAYGNNYLI